MANKKPKTKSKSKTKTTPSRPKPLSRKPGFSRSGRFYENGGSLS